MTTAQKIEWIKDHVNIEEYLTNRGYKLDKTRDCKKYRAYSSADNYDKIVVPVGADAKRRSYYFSQVDTADKGSVIDFVMTREGMDFAGAVEALLHYAAAPDFKAYEVTSQQISNRKAQEHRAEMKHRQIIRNILKLQAHLEDDRYLRQERKLSEKVLYHQAFLGRVYSVTYNGFTNIAFPMYAANREVKAMCFKNTSYEKLLGSKSQTLWISHYTSGKDLPVDKVIIGEHPIDLMSYFQLKNNPEENNLYVSYMGNPAEGQVQLLDYLINTVAPRQIVLANDNDVAGEKYDAKIIDNIHFQGQIVVDKPGGAGDWNEALKKTESMKVATFS